MQHRPLSAFPPLNTPPGLFYGGRPSLVGWRPLVETEACSTSTNSFSGGSSIPRRGGSEALPSNASTHLLLLVAHELLYIHRLIGAQCSGSGPLRPSKMAMDHFGTARGWMGLLASWTVHTGHEG